MSTHFVSIIGSGNVAWHLAPALDNSGFVIKEVYSRNPKHAEALTERLYQAEVKATLDFSTSDSTIFIIATRDAVIQDIAREIILPDNAILVHTSGTQPMSVLQFSASSHVGVLYPLQTFSQSRKLDFKTVPLFIETNDEETGEVLLQLSKAISNTVHLIGSEERKALHIAAVFAANFSNHMMTISKDLLTQNGLQFDWLIPLITETVAKGLADGPEISQTGPAKRGDLNVLDSHMEFLQGDKVVAEIYKVVSQHIMDRPELLE